LTSKSGISLNGLILIAACLMLGAGLAWLPDAPGILTFVFVAAAWVLSVAVHEFGHAYVAYRAGDHTVAEKGYLSLDPLKYTDLSTTLVFPLLALAMGGIGFPGGAVYLRSDLMRSPWGRAASSLAGPAGTLAVLLVLTVLVVTGIGQGDGFNPLIHAMAFLALLQATALVLNLLPIPGLDGYGALRPFLPTGVQLALRRWEPLGLIALLGALLFLPGASNALFALAFGLVDRLGIPRAAIADGYQAFRFWRGG
jgi:Zn-dependent protease